MKIGNAMKAWSVAMFVAALLFGIAPLAAAEDTDQPPAKMVESPDDANAADDAAMADTEADETEAAAQDQADDDSE